MIEAANQCIRKEKDHQQKQGLAYLRNQRFNKGIKPIQKNAVKKPKRLDRCVRENTWDDQREKIEEMERVHRKY